LEKQHIIIDDPELCISFAGAELSVIEHMNEDHQTSISHYASVHAPNLAKDIDATKWKMTGIDPDGIDLKAGDVLLRVPFEKAPISADDIRATLVAMTKAG